MLNARPFIESFLLLPQRESLSGVVPFVLQFFKRLNGLLTLQECDFVLLKLLTQCPLLVGNLGGLSGEYHLKALGVEDLVKIDGSVARVLSVRIHGPIGFIDLTLPFVEFFDG
jgi:hypothetical protein